MRKKDSEQALRERWGHSQGTKQLVEVLMLHRDVANDTVHTAVGLALSYGCLDVGAIRVLVRQLCNGERKAPPLPLSELGELIQYERPPLGLGDYDALLHSLEVH